jgi:hypothetical protein
MRMLIRIPMLAPIRATVCGGFHANKFHAGKKFR